MKRTSIAIPLAVQVFMGICLVEEQTESPSSKVPEPVLKIGFIHGTR